MSEERSGDEVAQSRAPAETPPRSGQIGRRGALRTPECIGDLRLGEVVDIAKNHGQMLLWRECRERVTDRRRFPVVCCVEGAGLLATGEIGQRYFIQNPLTSRAKCGHRVTDGDPVGPGIEPPRVAKRRDPAQHINRHVLGDIARSITISKCRSSGPECSVASSTREWLGGVPITRPEAPNEVRYIVVIHEFLRRSLDRSWCLCDWVANSLQQCGLSVSMHRPAGPLARVRQH